MRIESSATDAVAVRLRWMARALSAALIALVVAFVVGEGVGGAWAGVPLTMGVLLVLMCAGLVLAFWRPAIGALVVLVTFAALWTVNATTTGRAGLGWVFPLFPVAAALHAASWWRERARAEHEPA